MYGFIGSVSLPSNNKVSLYCAPHKGHSKLLQNETSWGDFQVKRLTLTSLQTTRFFMKAKIR